MRSRRPRPFWPAPPNVHETASFFVASVNSEKIEQLRAAGLVVKIRGLRDRQALPESMDPTLRIIAGCNGPGARGGTLAAAPPVRLAPPSPGGAASLAGSSAPHT